LRRWWPRSRLWGVVLAGLLLLWQGPGFVRSLRPPRTVTVDFFQDWASSRNLLQGLPIYEHLAQTVERYLGWSLPANLPPGSWRVNAHPPPGILPFVWLAWLDYPDACLVWNLFSLAALAASLVLVAKQLHIRIASWAILPVLACMVVCSPLRHQLFQGQINLVLLLLLCITWATARQAQPCAAGLALGAATAMKLFPGLLFVYFALRRQWTVVAAGLTALLAINILAVCLMGLQTYYSYVAEVLPQVAQFRSHWCNVSLVGLWSKLFDPTPAGGLLVPLWRSATLAQIGMVVSCAIIVCGVAWATRGAQTRDARDLAFGLTVIGMLLLSPVSWDHYLLMLLLPLAVIWVQLPPSGAVRWLWFALVGAFFLPPEWVWKVIIPGKWPWGIVTPVETLTALSWQCYALSGLFVLALAGQTWAVSRDQIAESMAKRDLFTRAQ
jgi:hypothetical protein